MVIVVSVILSFFFLVGALIVITGSTVSIVYMCELYPVAPLLISSACIIIVPLLLIFLMLQVTYVVYGASCTPPASEQFSRYTPSDAVPEIAMLLILCPAIGAVIVTVESLIG